MASGHRRGGSASGDTPVYPRRTPRRPLARIVGTMRVTTALEPAVGAADADPFLPLPGLAGGHRMTLYAWARSRRFPTLPPAEARLFPVSTDTRVLGHCHWQADRRRALTVILLHGLEGLERRPLHARHGREGLARAASMPSASTSAIAAAPSISRPGLYHSGLTADPLAVMRASSRTRGSSGSPYCRLFARRQHRAEARRRDSTARTRPASWRSARSRRPSSWRRAWTRSSAATTSPTTGTSFEASEGGGCAARRVLFPGRYDLGRLAGATSVRAVRRRSTRRRTTASPVRPTTTIAPAHAASSNGWPCRRSSLRRTTTRSCRRMRHATRRWPVCRISPGSSHGTGDTAGTSAGGAPMATTGTGPNGT